MDTLGIDIETYSSVDLKKQGVYRYVEADDFEILLFAYKLNDDPVKVIDLASGDRMPEFLYAALRDPNIKKTAYNASFEIACINQWLKAQEIKWQLDVSQWEDTMLLASYAGYGGSLKITAQLLGLPEDAQKDRTGTLLINKFSKPRKPTARDKRTRVLPRDDPEAWAKFKEYNKQDVVVESAIRNKLSHIQIPPQEQAGFLLDHKIMTSGVLIDAQLVKAAQDLDQVEKARLKQAIKDITGVDNPKSNNQIRQWLSTALDTEIPSIKKEAIPELMDLAKEKGLDDVIEVLNLRQELNKTSLAKYDALGRMMCRDNRIRGMLQFYGSRTGRWAGRGVQVQNLPRNYLGAIECARMLLKQEEYEGLKLIYGSNLSDIASQLIRTVFIPSPGKVFAVADYSAIEARVIAWISGEKWRIDAFKNSQDIYCVSASQMFDVPLEKILDKNAPEHALRAQGKVAELALGYQGAVGAIDRMDFNHSIPEEDRPRIVKQWREKSPHIVKLWADCEAAAINAVNNPGSCYMVNDLIQFYCKDNVLEIILPSGRSMYYPDVRIAKNPYGRTSIDYLGTNQQTRKIDRIYLYGGKLVENIVQATARDCLAEALLRLDQAGYEIKFHVHDEAILEVDKATAQQDLDHAMEIMCQETWWAKGLPLNAAGFTSEFYMKD